MVASTEEGETLMPTHPKHPCSHPRCPELVERGKSRCPTHEVRENKVREEQRGTAHERGYDSKWKKARVFYLRRHPLCVNCLKEGRTVPARVVDHIVAHNGDQTLFWDSNNWQALCDFTSPFNCHGTKTAREANARKD